MSKATAAQRAAVAARFEAACERANERRAESLATARPVPPTKACPDCGKDMLLCRDYYATASAYAPAGWAPRCWPCAQEREAAVVARLTAAGK